MISNFLKRALACVLSAIMLLSLCACKPYIDQDFIDLNLQAQTKPTEPSEPMITIPNTEPSEPEETEPAPSTPNKKPGGFVLDEPTEPTIKETEPIVNPDKEPEQNPTTPSKPSGGANVGNIKVSGGLKAALNSIGKTLITGTYVTAFHPNKGADGGITIFRIKNGANSAQQTMYTYYESASDYEKAKAGISSSACDDSLRLITRNTTDILPVTDPETMGIVLFDGYVLWR